MKRTHLLISASLVFFLMIISCDKESDLDLYGSIEGIVTDAITNEPIQGALVTISPINTSKNTGSDGRYTFSNLEPTTFTVQISNNGYETNTKTITVEPGETRNGDVQLNPVIPIISTSVTSLDFGSNLTSLPIEITNIGRGELNWTISENASWISVNPLSGVVTNETDNIIISIDRTGLSVSDYQQSISIVSNGGNVSISITMNVDQ